MSTTSTAIVTVAIAITVTAAAVNYAKCHDGASSIASSIATITGRNFTTATINDINHIVAATTTTTTTTAATS
eukprot:9327055-Pyramimonas_sp.AAC.1